MGFFDFCCVGGGCVCWVDFGKVQLVLQLGYCVGGLDLNCYFCFVVFLMMVVVIVFVIFQMVVVQIIVVKLLVDVCLCYEDVDQIGIVVKVDVLMICVWVGVQVISGFWLVLVEVQGNLVIDGNYYDGVNGVVICFLVVDLQNIVFYCVQFQYKIKVLVIIVGWQWIMFDDEWYVGVVNFCQNGQIFDVVCVEWIGVVNLKVDVSYVWGVWMIWGIDGVGVCLQLIDGDNVFVNLSYKILIGMLIGFVYLVDQDELIVQVFWLLSQIYGGCFVGLYVIMKVVKLFYVVSYVCQLDYYCNFNCYQVDYYLVDVGFDVYGVKFGGGYEVFGVDCGIVLMLFQFLVDSVFKFQGWVNKFFIILVDGVCDVYGSVGYGWKVIGLLKVVILQVVYYCFESDWVVCYYGNEVDLFVSVKFCKMMILVCYVDYCVDCFVIDMYKFWF